MASSTATRIILLSFEVAAPLRVLDKIGAWSPTDRRQIPSSLAGAAQIILYHFMETLRRVKSCNDQIAQNAALPANCIAQLVQRLFVLKQACLGFRQACETEGRIVFSADDTERDRVIAAEVQSLRRLNALTFEYQLVSSSPYRPLHEHPPPGGENRVFDKKD